MSDRGSSPEGQPYPQPYETPGYTEPYAGQPYAGQPYAGQPYAEQPYAEQPYAEQPYAGQPYAEQLHAEQPYAEQPYAGQPYAQPPYAEPPYGEPYPPTQAGYGYGYSYGYGVAGPTRPTNTLAVVSLVAGVVGLFVIPLIGSLLAVITGHVSRRQIRENGEGGDGMAVAGLITGWIGVAIWAGFIVIVVVLATIAVTAGSTH